MKSLNIIQLVSVTLIMSTVASNVFADHHSISGSCSQAGTQYHCPVGDGIYVNPILGYEIAADLRSVIVYTVSNNTPTDVHMACTTQGSTIIKSYNRDHFRCVFYS